MKIKVFIISLLILVSCSDDNNLERNFINEDDYWAVYYQGSKGFYDTCFKFKPNGKSDRYCRDSINLSLCQGSDIITSDIPWEVTSDSVLKWGLHEYYIINCNQDMIVLYSGSKENSQLFLIKEYPVKLRNGRVYYEKKEKLQDKYSIN